MRIRKLLFGLAWIALSAAMALPCLGSEVAVLKNGFSIKHERREVVGDVTRLYVTKDGSSFVDVPTADIEHFEAAPEDPAPIESRAANYRLPATRLAASGFRRPAPATSAMNPPSAVSAPNRDLTDVVNEASGRYRLDPDLVNSVIKAESGFNARAVSPKGAQGLMQLMPGTASQLGVPNAFDPQANVEGGAKYLRELLEHYNFDLVKALAAYNAGPQRVEHFGGVPPYRETRAYVARIVKDFNKKKIAQKAAASTSQKTASSKSASAQAATARNSTTKPTTGVRLQARAQNNP
jgi:hypothetical protein